MNETMYRYEDVHYAPPSDEFGDARGRGTVVVTMREYSILRRTPRGYWIEVNGDERFVLAGAHRRFACLTLDEARASFVARKKREIQIYTARIERARRALEATP